jgi:hypothetical protein
MTACTYREASSYAPVFPSPLNPTNHGPENKYGPARIVRRRRSRSGRRGPPGSHTLTQRFLRVKAADAWRGHVLSAQVAKYESAEAAVMAFSGPKSTVSFYNTDIIDIRILTTSRTATLQCPASKTSASTSPSLTPTASPAASVYQIYHAPRQDACSLPWVS